MAEARSAAAHFNVPPDPELAKSDLHEILVSTRRSLVRYYYRTRNSIRNGTWPTSLNNLGIAFMLIVSLLLCDVEMVQTPKSALWRLSENQFFSWIAPLSFPRLLRALLFSSLLAVCFFIVLMAVRQLILRALLRYRGWMHQRLRKPSWRMILWGTVVKLVSGYKPSLYSTQRSLPRMVVPPLQDTIRLTLESLEPIVDEEELEQLRREAEVFKAELAPKLQRVLVLKSWWAQNYVSDWWEKYVYLRSRTPLVINSNYYCMDHSYFKPTHRQVPRAAAVLNLLLNAKRRIDWELLPPLFIRNTIPVCMAQYERLFSTVRVPKKGCDEIVHYPASQSKHVMVNSLGYLYAMEVYDSKGQILCARELEKLLSWILEDSRKNLENEGREDPSTGVSALTRLDRDAWADLRHQHFRKGRNRDSMDLIDRAVLMLTLSAESPSTLTDRGKFLLHGDGLSHWFDKSVNVVVFANANCGMNVEHSFADAPAMGHMWELAMTSEALDKVYSTDGFCMPERHTFRQAAYRSPRKLEWEVPDDLAQVIRETRATAITTNADLDLMIYDHHEWGKGDMKKCKVSPDAFIQMAIQLSFFKERRKFCLVYEASMTRLYLNGRTETVRSCTNESTAFVRSMVDPSVSKEERLRLLRVAADRHTEQYRNAMNGRGVDRHLFALYIVCRGLGQKSDFLEHVLFYPWTLSTSQQPQQQETDGPVAEEHMDIFKGMPSPGGGFGPVSDDGYGISYMLPTNDQVFFHVSSKHSCPLTSSSRFMRLICESMEEMRELILPSQLPSSNGVIFANGTSATIKKGL